MKASKQHKEDQNAEKKSSENSASGDEGSSTNSSLDHKESNKETEEEKKEDPDVVFVQDVGFTIKIMAPGVEPFDIQVYKLNLFGYGACSLDVFCSCRCPAWKWCRRSISC